MSSSSRNSSLTPLRSPSPSPPTQPDHFYGADDVQLPPSPSSDGKTWLDPEDDPQAHRGIPVFKPTMEEFEDFEEYVTKIECWGMKSGIVKIIPPKEWTEALPPLKEQLVGVKIRTPIEQNMFGSGGRFRQENMEKRKVMSPREWAELCAKDEFRAPGVGEVGLQARSTYVRPRTRKSKKTETGPEQATLVKEESVDAQLPGFIKSSSSKDPIALSPPNSVSTPQSPTSASAAVTVDEAEEDPKPKTKKRTPQTKQSREAALADRAAQDLKFIESFDPHKDWLPPNTTAADYTREFCQVLERQYWRNCSLGKPPWYGADTAGQWKRVLVLNVIVNSVDLGTLFTDETTSWNVGKLPSALSRLLPANQSLPGVNTPYLYYGMWRATFAWHVEDMDLFSINYIHFGAPKFWYAIPQARAAALEQAMKGYFPKDSKCSQFLRHKSFLVSPTTLAQSSCRPNFLVQHAGEFVITFPRGYHAGFNLGFNCAESVNFALDSWIELGRRAKVCECVGDSVTIDVDLLLAERAAEAGNPPPPLLPVIATPPKPKRTAVNKEKVIEEEAKVPRAKPALSRKRKIEAPEEGPKSKKLKIRLSPSKSAQQPTQTKLTLKIGPRPAPLEPFPCCLCISMDRQGLLRVYDPPFGRKDAEEAAGNPKEWMAHEYCAKIVPETWVDEIELNGVKEKVVYGVDGIVRDRWHLKCSSCTKNRPKAHGAPIQCTKGKCSKAFHVSCARDGAEWGILYSVTREVEKDVLLVAPSAPVSAVLVTPANPADAMQVDTTAPPHTLGVEPPVAPSSQVLKTIKKLEVQVLCSQHNPIVAAAKKEAKQDKVKAALLALPEMARIKLRVSSGVFEVSLLKVNEATSSVEVLWDKGDRKEFKWSSVLFGNTDIPVQHKPSEIPPKPLTIALPAQTYTSVQSANATKAPAKFQYQPQPVASTSRQGQGTSQHAYGPSSQYYPPHTTNYNDSWRYQNPQYAANHYAYSGYYPPTAGASTGSQYSSYVYQPQTQYHPTQYKWQQSYQGQSNVYPQTVQQSKQQSPAQQQPMDPTQTQPQPSTGAAQPHSQATGPPSPYQHPAPPPHPAPLSPEVQQALISNLTALSSLQPGQFEDVFKNNPHLRDVAMAAGRQPPEVPPS
ncbi:hypothetical protein H0H87_010561 [Tephrocybe sp. NHM501043]|nr:hypothetical protein H0H87_010561 [Tephrocybe sp. NHM501043]